MSVSLWYYDISVSPYFSASVSRYLPISASRLTMSENKTDGHKKQKGNQQETPDYEARWKRAVADYQNLEKRVAKEQKELVKFSNFILISKLLPVLDDLSEAVKKGGDKGVTQILKKLKGVLEEGGLEEIEAEGKEFDPATMEGIAGEERSPKEEGQALKSPELGSEEIPEPSSKSLAPPEGRAGLGNSDSKVVKVMRKGYTLNGRLLRAARVKVKTES